MILLLLLLLLTALTRANNAPYCHFSGCADSDVCQCYEPLMYCGSNQCHFTPMGIGLMVAGAILVLSLLGLLLRFCHCCYKLWRCCCGGGGKGGHRHVHYHGGKANLDVIEEEDEYL